MLIRPAAVAGLLTTLAIGCGGAPAPADTPADTAGADSEASSTTASSEGEPSRGMGMSAEVGALDKKEVQGIISGTMPDVESCLDAGRKKLSFLGGDVKIYLRVNQSGKAEQGYFVKSTLGDHEVEACIMKAFTSKQWPRPQGGEAGEISQAFDFSGVESPKQWSSGDLESKMAEEFAALQSKLGECRKEAKAGPLTVTMYLDEDGMARAVGLSSGDQNGAAAASCVAMTVQTTSFPSPGDNFAKVTVNVQ